MWSQVRRSALRFTPRYHSLFVWHAQSVTVPIHQSPRVQKRLYAQTLTLSDMPVWYEINLEEGSHDGDTKDDTGPDGAEDGDISKYAARHRSVLSQLQEIPKDAKNLRIREDVPGNEEWAMLGSHLTSVENLEVEAGFEEDLNDRLTPVHWPLKRYFLSSTCGQVVQNPHILLGKVEHLIFYLTMEIRFEGPTTDELTAAHWKAADSGEKEQHHVSESGLKWVYVSQLVQDWMVAKYKDKELDMPSRTAPPNTDVYHRPESSSIDGSSDKFALTKLEILENNAIETFTLFSIALPRIAYNLRTLNIRSTNGCDFSLVQETIFVEQLVHMDQLEDLTLTIGQVFSDDSTLTTLHKAFPKGLHTLRFRGPISLTEHAEWETWVARFADPSFLPKLKRLSFICDIAYDEKPDTETKRRKRKASDDELQRSKAKCEQLISALRTRNRHAGEGTIEVEPFVEVWSDKFSYMNAVDPRWASI